jgi:6-phosphogluconolactonase
MKNTTLLTIVIFLIALFSYNVSFSQAYFFVAANGENNPAGIRTFSLNEEDGSITQVGENGHLKGVSYFNLSPDRKFLYAVGNDQVSAFSVGEQGKIQWLNSQSSEGRGPSFVSTDQTGKFVFVANYGGGTISMYAVKDDGSLQPATQSITYEGSSVNPDRQKEPHPHMILTSPNNKYVFVPDLGTDKVMAYALDEAAGKITAAPTPFVQMKPGSGPRHFEIHPDQKTMFVLNELVGTVTSVSLEGDYGLKKVNQTYNLLPEGFSGQNSSADIHITPDGKFLYGTNRGPNSLAMFKVLKGGKLEFIGHESTRGETPRNFTIDPTGKYLLLANQRSDNLIVFRIDPASGKLAFLHEYQNVPGPMCIKFID